MDWLGAGHRCSEYVQQELSSLRRALGPAQGTRGAAAGLLQRGRALHHQGCPALGAGGARSSGVQRPELSEQQRAQGGGNGD